MSTLVNSNRFSGGMSQDVDKHFQKGDTYRFAKNTRIRFNQDGADSMSGTSFAISNARGTIEKSLLCSGYELLKVIETKNGAVGFSSNGVNSEIGYFIIEDNLPKTGKLRYYTLYNDRRDPNGDKLNLHMSTHIDGFSIYENEFIERVYWVDGYNEKRSINLNDFFKDKKTFINCETDTLCPIHGGNYSAI